MAHRSIFFLLVFTLAGNAQTSLSVEDAVRLALAHRPELKAADARLRAAENLKRQAGYLPNPRFFFQTENLRGSNFDLGRDADTFTYFSQTLETSGRRGNRVAVASEAVERNRLEAEQLRRAIGFRVREAYWTAVAAQFTAHLFDEQESYFRQVIAYHEARLREGKLAEVDLLRVRLQGEQIHAAAENARLDTERAGLLLAREMGMTEPASWSFSEKFDETESHRSMTAADPLEARPEGRLAQQELVQARAGLGLARAIGRPDLDLLFGYKRTSGLNTTLAGLQLNVPLFDRNQGARAAAQANVLAAEESLAGARIQLGSELSLARREHDTRLRQVRSVFAPLRQQAVEISDISRAAYREGGLDLLRLLDAERLRIDAQLEWVRALAEYHKSVINLERAEGVEP